MIRSRFLTLCLMSVLSLGAQADLDRLSEDVAYGFSLTGTAGGGAVAPFWFTNNRYGLGPVENNSVLARAYIKRDAAEDEFRNWRLGYGADIVAGYGHQSYFNIQQAYFDVDWKMLRLSLGQKERPSELKDPELTTGGMTLGMNARPLPQVRLEMPDFWTVPGTKGFFAFKAHIAFGWYTDNKWQRDWAAANESLYTSNSGFHSKSLLFRFGNEERFPLTLKFGLEMACQYNGTGYNVIGYTGKKIKHPVDLGGNPWTAFTATGGDVNDDEFANAAGNHVGSWHLRLDWKCSNWSIGAYMDHFFEDHSQMFMQYGFWKDMLLGLEVNLPRNPYVSTILYEHNGTMNQSGPMYHDATVENSQQISAKDSYYHNHVYGSWQHAGFLMGNPTLISPLYNGYLGMAGTLYNYFNRVNVHHVGLKGNPCKNLSWRALYTYEKNLGSYDIPVKDPLYGHFLLLEATYKVKQVKGLEVTAAYGHNSGSLLGTSNGMMITAAWNGWIWRSN